jgi:hypothetical protein
VETRLLVHSVKKGRFLALLRVEGSVQIKFETLRDLVVEFNLAAKYVGGGPSLSDGEPVLVIRPLSLDVAIDDRGLGITRTASFEGHIGRRLGLYFKRNSLVGIILAKEVVGGLAEILPDSLMSSGFLNNSLRYGYLP